MTQKPTPDLIASHDTIKAPSKSKCVLSEIFKYVFFKITSAHAICNVYVVDTVSLSRVRAFPCICSSKTFSRPARAFGTSRNSCAVGPLTMKDISLPPDAVHCECSLLATRSPRIKMATGVTAASHRHPRPRSLSRFLETIVRKVFDSQRKAKDVSAIVS